MPAITLASAPPSPPIMECSSTVTTRDQREAAARIALQAIGLIVAISTTPTETPPSENISAAGENKPVAIRHVRIGKINVYKVFIENGHNISHRQG